MRARSFIPLAPLATLLAAGPARAVDPPIEHVLAPEKLAAGDRRPLVVYLHGLGGSGADALESPALRKLSQRHRLFVVAPDGDRDRQGRRFWNAGPACCNFDRSQVDDVARLTQLIDRWRRRPEIDPARVYLLGFSNGGFMAHRLACRIPERLTAVASLAGAGIDGTGGEGCAPGSSPAVLEVHGDADSIVRAGGGRVFDSPDLAPHPSAAETVRGWGKRLGCRRVARKTEGASPQIRIEAHEACRTGRAQLWLVEGAGHQLVTPDIVDRVASFLLEHRTESRPAAASPK